MMRVLVAEDNPVCAELLLTVISDNGWEVSTANEGRRAVELLEAASYHVALLDINLPQMDGFEVLQRIQSVSPETRVIIVSGSIGVTETVRAMKLGAVDCLAKPFRMEELTTILKRVEQLVTTGANSSQSDMVAVSAPMREVSATITNVAKSRASTVLITGETGTGKEIVARRLHRCSDRHDKPFVAINCSAIPPSLIESELFGHEKGAFTDARSNHKGYFETSADGTLFLDEIGDLSLELQGKLLRVLQERVFRRVGGTQEIPLQARVIAATNRDLADSVRQGKFREDLYYRLAIIPIHLLPLRERQADIIPLAERFLVHFSKELKCDAPALTEMHRQALLKHTWPGNVRELRNVMERFVVMNGRLEFVSSTRDLGTLARPAVNRDDSTVISEAERTLIYDILLKKLLSEEKAGRAKVCA